MKSPLPITRRQLLRQAAVALPALSALPALGLAGGPHPLRALAGPPAPPPLPPQKVVVAGAGLAGLAAAWELVALGHQVTVLEAQSRPGGRVLTLRQPFASGLYVEAGAADFADSCPHVLRYVKVFNLPLAAPDPSRLATVYALRGRRLALPPPGAPAAAPAGPAMPSAAAAKAAPAAPPAPPDWPFQLTAEERRLGLFGMFAKYFAPADQLGDPTAADWRLDPFRGYDRMTVAGFLAAQGASAAAVEMLGDCLWFGYGWQQVSALHRLLSDVALFCQGAPIRVLAGGNDQLPRAFAAALGDRVRYEAPLVRVEQLPDGVRAVFRQGGTEQRLDADRLVCALPCPALGRVTFGPELPAAKRRIFEQLEYNPVTRIYLQTRRRIWQQAGESGTAFTDLPVQAVLEQPAARPAAAGGRGILECHVKGPEAQRLAALDEPARLAWAAGQLDRIFPGFGREVEAGASVAWSADPWAGGGYAWWKPGQLTDWLPELAKAEGRIHFAGEHTSLLGRTMEGALESGNRAAREVHLVAAAAREPRARGAAE